MKITLRVPTQEQFAFVEIEFDEDGMTAEQVRKAYDEYTLAFKFVDGLEQREWNEVLDFYRQGKGMSEETMSRLNKAQAWLIHEIDKSDNRLKK